MRKARVLNEKNSFIFTIYSNTFFIVNKVYIKSQLGKLIFNFFDNFCNSDNYINYHPSEKTLANFYHMDAFYHFFEKNIF
jgi:hypothetical protein